MNKKLYNPKYYEANEKEDKAAAKKRTGGVTVTKRS